MNRGSSRSTRSNSKPLGVINLGLEIKVERKNLTCLGTESTCLLLMVDAEAHEDRRWGAISHTIGRDSLSSVGSHSEAEVMHAISLALYSQFERRAGQSAAGCQSQSHPIPPKTVFSNTSFAFAAQPKRVNQAKHLRHSIHFFCLNQKRQLK